MCELYVLRGEPAKLSRRTHYVAGFDQEGFVRWSTNGNLALRMPLAEAEDFMRDNADRGLGLSASDTVIDIAGRR